MGRVRIIKITKPPPSVNAMWRAVPRKQRGGKTIAVNILSKEGRDWKDLAAKELGQQTGIGSGEMYWRADILIPGKGTRADLDNYLKGILDALVESEIAPDDRYLVDLRIRFHSGHQVRVALKQEDLHLWAKIRHASRSLIKKLEKSLN